MLLERGFDSAMVGGDDGSFEGASIRAKESGASGAKQNMSSKERLRLWCWGR